MVQILYVCMRCSWDHLGKSQFQIYFFRFSQVFSLSQCLYLPAFPTRDSKTWNTSGIEGVHRFLARTWRLVIGLPQSDGSFKDGTIVTDDEPTLEQLRTLHKCIAKVISFPKMIICCLDTSSLRSICKICR